MNFYEEVKDKLEEIGDEELFALFQKHLVPSAQNYYDIVMASYKSYQSEFTPELYQVHVSKKIRDFASIKEIFEEYSKTITTILEEGLKQFNEMFPEFKIESPILIGHSMGCFDGAIRYLDKTKYLVFGIDVISRLYQDISAKPFIIHELFHEYHRPLYQMYKMQGSLLDALWMEGLAVYVSELMSPGASKDEILLNNPKGMIQKVEQNIQTLIVELENNLEELPQKIYQKYFLGPFDENRYRAGYYIGYLFAKHLGNMFSLSELVLFSGEKIYPYMKEFLKQLKK